MLYFSCQRLNSLSVASFCSRISATIAWSLEMADNLPDGVTLDWRPALALVTEMFVGDGVLLFAGPVRFVPTATTRVAPLSFGDLGAGGLAPLLALAAVAVADEARTVGSPDPFCSPRPLRRGVPFACSAPSVASKSRNES